MSAARFDATPIDQSARRVWELVEGLEVSFAHERSLRICRGSLLANRFLLSVARRSVSGDACGKIRNVCRQLGMPEPFRDDAARFLASAEYLHFGFEEGPASSLYKVYLELGVPAGRGVGMAPVLLHVAYKWDVMEPSRSAVTRYFWYPSLSISASLERTAALFPAGHSSAPFEIIREVFLLAERRAAGGGFRYLEATEDRSARHSFDVNLYEANLVLQDLAPLFTRMCEYFAISPERFTSVTAREGTKRLGHIAGGIHRTGEDFFNVYYGVVEGGRGKCEISPR
jgi:hypothetical protein